MKKRLVWVAIGTMLLLSACGNSGKSDSTDTGSAVKEATSEELKQSDNSETNVTEKATTEAEESEEPEVLTLTLSATGDCTLGKTQEQGYTGSFWDYYDTNGEEYFFDGVRDIFEADDMTLINLECVLTNEETRVEKAYNLKGFPEYTGIMTSSSIEACSTGNNHCRDYGDQSQLDTQNALDQAGIAWAYNEKIGTYTTDNGLVVGFVSANLLNAPDENLAILKEDIATLQEEDVDLIVACCHWGIEKEYYPTDYQTSSARALVDAGADLVIGNHPHVLQGIEVYNGKVICYSLGNFCFGGNRNPADKNTMIFQQTFTYVDGQLQTNLDAKIIPCTLSGHSDYNDFQPALATGDKKQTIIDKVTEYSAPYGNLVIDEEGNLVVGE